jgi:hypothetical protein
MGNYVIGVGNYVIVSPSELGNYMIADTVVADQAGYQLSFTAPDQILDDGARLHDAALVLLRRVNGVAQTLRSDFRPVDLSGRFSDETGGQHRVVLADSAVARARVNLCQIHRRSHGVIAGQFFHWHLGAVQTCRRRACRYSVPAG